MTESSGTSEGEQPDVSNEAQFEVTDILEVLPARLGVVETETMTDSRQRAIEAIASGAAEARELMGEFIEALRESIEALKGFEYQRGNIGVDLEIARIWREAGKKADYIDALYDVLLNVMQRDEFADILAIVQPLYDEALNEQ